MEASGTIYSMLSSNKTKAAVDPTNTNTDNKKDNNDVAVVEKDDDNSDDNTLDLLDTSSEGMVLKYR